METRRPIPPAKSPRLAGRPLSPSSSTGETNSPWSSVTPTVPLVNPGTKDVELYQAPGTHVSSPKQDQPMQLSNARVSTVHKEYTLPILYKLSCMDMEHRGTIINRFSEQAFSGFDHELDQPNRQDLAVIDVISSVHGTFPEGKHRRKNQSRKNFGTPLLEDDRAPFELGKDFIVRSKDRAPSIRVFSPQIIEHIRNELRYYPTLNIPDIELIVHPPYEPLAFCHDGLVAAAQDVDKNLPSPDEVSNLGKTRNHFCVLLDWFQPYYQKEIEPEKDVHRRGKATFPNLWLLYKPGSTVFAGQGKSISFYKVLSFSPKDEKHERRWVLSVWGLDFNGLRLGRRAKTFEIAEFEGEKAIKQLPVKPIRHMEQDDGDEEALTERGKSYYQIIRQAPVHLQYKGALSGNNLLQYSGKIMIDPTNYPAKPRLSSNSHLRMLGTAAPSSPSSLDKRDIASDFEEPKDMGGGPLYSKFNDVVLSEEIQPGDEEMYLLMPSKIRGFALGKNQWAEFDISGVYALGPMSAPFGSLAIGDTELHLIRALGLTDFTLDRDDTFRNDFVQGKGLNQVILLHGPPGVGKTLTVECLAEELGRPLLNLTVADIGTKESEMEHRLAGWLDLAQRWNAIVLIDEADIYLARRERNELQRSALVTAFLRTLEYFIGLMFLTTNQPGFIDDAFNSRFHLIIEYPRLNEEQRTTIWQSFLHKLHRDQGQHNQPTKIRINVLGDVQNYLTTNTDVKALELNGRDIRNAFHAAIQIAIHRTDEENRKRYRNQGIGQPMTDVDLTVNDIKKVIDNKAAYRAYLTNVHGQNEEERALDYGGRRT